MKITLNKSNLLYLKTDKSYSDINASIKMDETSNTMHRMCFLKEYETSGSKKYRPSRNIELWKLMEDTYTFNISDSGVKDDEFNDYISSLLRLFGENSSYNKQCSVLYNFLTGGGVFRVNMQLALLKSLSLSLKETKLNYNDLLMNLLLNDKSKNIEEEIKELIEYGNLLPTSDLEKKNQRLSVRGLDLLLLKCMRISEKGNQTDGKRITGIEGWYIREDKGSVWNKKLPNPSNKSENQSYSIGEVALFDMNILEIPVGKAGYKKSKRAKSKIRRLKKFHSRKRKSKHKKSKNNKKRKYRNRSKNTKSKK